MGNFIETNITKLFGCLVFGTPAFRRHDFTHIETQEFQRFQLESGGPVDRLIQGKKDIVVLGNVDGWKVLNRFHGEEP